MNVTHRFTFTEDQLRSIRASEGRGGRASRNEVRSWLDVLVQATLQDLPAPKRRRKIVTVGDTFAVHPRAQADVDDENRLPRWSELVPQERRALVESLDDDATCAGCGYRKDEHGRMGFACPPPCRGTFVPRNSSQ